MGSELKESLDGVVAHLQNLKKSIGHLQNQWVSWTPQREALIKRADVLFHPGSYKMVTLTFVTWLSMLIASSGSLKYQSLGFFSGLLLHYSWLLFHRGRLTSLMSKHKQATAKLHSHFDRLFHQCRAVSSHVKQVNDQETFHAMAGSIVLLRVAPSMTTWFGAFSKFHALIISNLTLFHALDKFVLSSQVVRDYKVDFDKLSLAPIYSTSLDFDSHTRDILFGVEYEFRMMAKAHDLLLPIPALIDEMMRSIESFDVDEFIKFYHWVTNTAGALEEPN